MAMHSLRGGSGVFVTLTQRHHRGDELAPRLAVMSTALGQVLRGRPWEKRRERLGYVGSIRATEVTWGEANGWHPHTHALLLFDRRLTAAEIEDLSEWIQGRWAGIVERLGLGTINGHGVDVRPITSAADLGSYLAKVDAGWSVGLELARSDRKSAAPMELLTNLVETGEARWARLWTEYEEATFGKQAIVWSAGLRELLLGSEVETSDEDAASMEGADLTLLRALVQRQVWNRLVKAGRQGELLTELEQVAGVLLWLTVASGHVAQPLDDPRDEPEGGVPNGPPQAVGSVSLPTATPIGVTVPAYTPVERLHRSAVGPRPFQTGTTNEGRRATARGAGGWPPGVAVVPPAPVSGDHGDGRSHRPPTRSYRPSEPHLQPGSE